MITFFKNWCEEIIISSFIVSILEMLVPEGNIKKYIKVVTGVYIIFVILSPVLTSFNNKKLEEEISNIIDSACKESKSIEETKIDESYEILNTISSNLKNKEEMYAGEIQEEEN